MKILNKLFLGALFIINSITMGQNGVAKSYYPDKTLESQISYTDGVFDGPAFWYYPNGNLKTEKNFSLGKLNGWVREYYESGLLKEEYNAVNGVLDGSYKKYFMNGALKEIVKYEKGFLKDRTVFDYDPFFKTPPELYQAGNRQLENLKNHKEEFFCDVEECPVPVGGFKVIQDNLVYPEHAIMYGLQGTVTLIATIDVNGDVTSSQIIKHLGLGCDEAAQDAVKKTKFIPGATAGKPVESHATINVEFKIPGKENIAAGVIDQSAPAVADSIAAVKKEIAEVTPTEVKKSEPAPAQEVRKDIPRITCDADVCPVPDGGMEALMKNVEIPAIAKRLKLKGEIKVSAVIDEYGLVRDTKVESGIGYGCDDAVEIAVLKTKFIPAKKAGMNTRSKILVVYPFRFDQ